MAAARELVGVVLILCGVQFSVAANTVVKLLNGVPMLQLMQARFLMQWACSMSLSCAMKLSGRSICIAGPPGCRLFLAVRATTYTGALMTFWCALRYLPVGEATAIVYLHPVFCGLLAHFLLQEPLGRIFWLQGAVSCTGVALVANLYGALAGEADKDRAGGFAGEGLALLACLCFASGNCVVRLMPRCQPLEVQVFTDSVIALVAMPAALCLSGSVPDWDLWTGTRLVLLLAFTAFGIGSSFLAITGFKMAPATIAALFMYLEVPSSFAVQVCVFGEMPGAAAVAGAALITLAAFARLAYEARRSGEDLVDPKAFRSPNSVDSNDECFDSFDAPSRQGTLEACLGAYILARQASARPYTRFSRAESERPTGSLFSPLTAAQTAAERRFTH